MKGGGEISYDIIPQESNSAPNPEKWRERREGEGKKWGKGEQEGEGNRERERRIFLDPN